MQHVMKCARRRGEDELQWTRGRQIGMADQRKKEQETTKLQAGLILVTCELLPWAPLHKSPKGIWEGLEAAASTLHV